MKVLYTLVLTSFFMLTSVIPSSAERLSSADILRAGLLGAGSGAVGGAASGGSGRDIWKGALAGMATNIIGGALIDAIAGSSGTSANDNTRQVRTVQRTAAPGYQAPAPNYAQGQYQAQPRTSYSEGYQEGYYNGFKEGYLQGLRDAAREAGLAD